MPHAHHAAVESYWVAAVLLLTALIYLRGWFRLRWLEPNSVLVWHAGSFILGLFLIWLALASPLRTLDHESLTAHMVQHLLLMTVTPPLILLGASATIFACGLPYRLLLALQRTLRSAVMQTIATAFSHPALCWLGAAFVLFLWHLPVMFLLALRSPLWHGIEQASFLATGLLFWWPVIRPWPGVSKWPESSMLLYLFFATLPCDILSGFLVFCDRVVYPAYVSSPRLFGMSALEDQQCAAALMWTCVTIVFLVCAAIFTARLLAPRFPQEPSIPQLQSRATSTPRTAGKSMEAA